jgi:hypothetical protein
MAPRVGLIPVTRVVHRNGQVFNQTVYVRPNDVKKVNTGNRVNVPAYNIKSFNDLQAHIDRINNIKDISEKKIQRHHLLDYLFNNAGVKWKPDNGARQEDINWMRAMMASKKYYGAPKSQAPSQPKTQQQQGSSQQPPTGKTIGGSPMSKDDAKKAVRDLWKELGTQGVMDMAEANGIQWAKNPAHVANSYMQCAMKLSKHLQNGGSLTVGGKGNSTTQQAQAPQSQPKDQKQQSSAPKQGTLEYDWSKASPRGKQIAMACGIIPLDKGTEDYLSDMIKGDKIWTDDEEPDSGIKDVMSQMKLPHEYENSFERFMKGLESDDFIREKAFHQGYRGSFYPDESLFSTPEDIKEYRDYIKNRDEFIVEYDYNVYVAGAQGIQLTDSILGIKELKIKKDTIQPELFENFKGYLDTLLRKPEKELNDWFDKMDVAQGLRDSYYFSDGNKTPTLILLSLMGASSSFGDMVASLTVRDLGNGANINNLKNDLASGKFSRRDVLSSMRRALDEQQINNEVGDKHLKDINSRRVTSITDFFNNSDKPWETYKKEVLTGLQKLSTPEVKWIESCLAFKNFFANNVGNRAKAVEEYEAIPKEDFFKIGNKKFLYRRELYASRMKKTTRNSHRKKFTPPNAEAVSILERSKYGEAVRRGRTVDIPDKFIPEYFHAAMQKVPSAEALKVEAKIQATHDRVNHGGFSTKVHGIYRVLHLGMEDYFQDLDKKRDNTGFYYHGTRINSARLIVGGSGQFKVITSANAPKGVFNAGKMLGNGLYIAKQSSKAMQYAGESGFSRIKGDRGVLFLCKATLGNVEQSHYRGCGHNQAIMEQKTTDTVFMDKPDVINPEWAVKDPKAVIPRLWIDVERV